MYNIYIFMGVFIFFIGFYSFCVKSFHFLMILLSLEFITLTLFFMLYLYFSLTLSDLYFSMIYISMAVCEGSVGLALLVALMRSFGNDYFKALSLLW